MKQTFANVWKLSIYGYIFLFGSVFGFTAFGNTGSSSRLFLFYSWVIMFFIGGVLLSIKNSKILDPKMKLKIALADLFITLVSVVLIYALPAFLGLVRSAIILIVQGIYAFIYLQLLDKGKIIEKG